MITPEQREARRAYIGASDAAAVLGISPWTTPGDLWLRKTGRVDGEPENDAMRAGSMLEPVVLGWCEARLGRQVWAPPTAYDESGLLCANLDGAIDEAEFVEAKTSSSADGWGDEGTDEIPDYYLVQVAHQFACLPAARVCHVPVLIGERGFQFRLYRVERDGDLVEQVAGAGREFMTKYVRTDTPPDDFRPSLDSLKRLRRQPGTVADVPAELVARWQAAKAAAKAAEGQAEAAQAELLAALGEAEGGACPDGLVTYLQQTTRRLDGKRLAEELPEVAAKYMAESAYRVLRFKAAKSKGAKGKAAAVAAAK